MKLFFYICSFIVLHNKHYILKNIDNFKINKRNNGDDSRDIKDKNINYIELNKNLYKKKLLDTLINNNVSIIYKLKLVEEYENNKESKYISNIMKGGLMKDWQNNIDTI